MAKYSSFLLTGLFVAFAWQPGIALAQRESQPLPEQPLKHPNVSGLVLGQPALRFKNRTPLEVEISLSSKADGTTTKLKCEPGKTISLEYVPEGPISIELGYGGATFSRSDLDLDSIRRRMFNNLASIQTLADLETNPHAGEAEKVKNVVGSLLVIFPTRPPAVPMQAVFTQRRRDLTAMPSANPPEERPAPGK